MGIKIKTDTTEILMGKFAETISKIEGVYQEAEGDLKVDQRYTASGVYRRISEIRNTFYEDLRRLSKDIETE